MALPKKLQVKFFGPRLDLLDLPRGKTDQNNPRYFLARSMALYILKRDLEYGRS